MDAAAQPRAFWRVLADMVAMALMVGGDMASLQALTLSVVLPFTVVLLCRCVGLL